MSGLKTNSQASVIDKPTSAIIGTTITFAGDSIEVFVVIFTVSIHLILPLLIVY